MFPGGLLFQGAQGLQVLSRQLVSLTGGSGDTTRSAAITAIDTEKCLLMPARFEGAGTTFNEHFAVKPDTIVSGQYTQIAANRTTSGSNTTVHVEVLEVVNAKSINYYEAASSGAVSITSVDQDKSIILPHCVLGGGSTSFADIYFTDDDEVTIDSPAANNKFAVLEFY